MHGAIARLTAGHAVHPPSAALPQGYTGHEQLDSHKLVHMQGRVYDPALGRFLSADLFVQSPHSTQSFNRYSYVSNNPLSRIDPTGYADVGYGGRSGPEPADGVDCTKNPSQCPGTTHYNSCSDGATCMTGGEADSYMRDLAAMQTNSLGGMMGVPDINFGSVQELKTYLDANAEKQPDGSYKLNLTDGPAFIKLGAGDKNGKGVALTSPVGNAPITSRMGPRNPLVGSKNHKGTDYGVKVGTPVVATANGIVKYAGKNDGYGNMVVLEHSAESGGKIYTLYAHASSLSVVAGDSVTAGQQIMLSGNTGSYTTGPHLHYEIVTSPNGPTSDGLFRGGNNGDPRYNPDTLSGLLNQ
jgi:RHS repeat-associated protein